MKLNIKRIIVLFAVSFVFFLLSGCLPEDSTGEKEAVDSNTNREPISKEDGKGSKENEDVEDKMDLEKCFGLNAGNKKIEEIIINKTKLVILKGDITKLQVDAIVNAANEKLQGGGGVDGAIGKAAGREIYNECKVILDKRNITQLPTGEAVITSAGKLEGVKHIIHTPGPRWNTEWNEAKDKAQMGKAANLLKNSYVNSLNLAKENDCKAVAFPSISTGIFAYPLEQAASIAVSNAVDVVKQGKYTPNMIIFVLFGDKEVDVYKSIFAKLKDNN